MTSLPAVSIIIPVLNLWEMTLDCLRSLAEHSDIAHLEIIVVDNGSTDATAAALAPTGSQLFGDSFRHIRHPQNLGFAKACNAGAQAARAPLLFFLNNDTLLTPNWLPPLLDALAASPALGMVGPLLLLPSNLVQHCGIAFSPSPEVSHVYALFPRTHPLVHKSRPLQALTGAAFLLSKELFFRCGQFHEGYQNGFEDLDLCCLVRQQNLRLTCASNSVIYHLTSQTPGRADHDASNARLLNQRHPIGFVPDLHRIGLDDGYLPRLSPSLELYLTLTPEREQSLNNALRSFDEDRCRDHLASEPLWEQGYTLLTQHLESRRAFAAAANVRSTQLHFFPLAPYAVALARAAARAHRHDLARTAAEAAPALLHSAANTSELHHKATCLYAWSQKIGEKELEKIFGEWLKGSGEAGASPQTPQGD